MSNCGVSCKLCRCAVLCRTLMCVHARCVERSSTESARVRLAADWMVSYLGRFRSCQGLVVKVCNVTGQFRCDRSVFN